MSHVGFVAPPFLGHLNPMQALAAALVSHGHAVTFFGMADSASMIDESRWNFAPLGAFTHPPGALDSINRHMAAPSGLGLSRIMIDMTRTTEMLCRELPAACRAAEIDLLVTDQLEPAGGLVASHLGLPFVSVANALPINRDPSVPPPFTNWNYDPSDWGIRRNRGGYRVADLLMRPLAKTIARQAERLGLPHRHRLEDCLSPYAEVSQLVSGLDFPSRIWPDTMHLCGPFRPGEGGEDIEPLLGRRLGGHDASRLDVIDTAARANDDRPLAFASLGTLQGGRARSFAKIAEACAALELRLVIAHGGRLTARDCEGFAGSPIVRDFVPQRALLSQACLAIVNGGLNTVLDAAEAGVPVIALPIAFEQGAIAARLVQAGAGLALPHRRLTAHRLQAGIATILNDPSYALRSKALSREIASAGGARLAASIIEAVAASRRPVTRTRPALAETARQVQSA